MSSERETKSLVTPDNWSYHPEIPEGWKFQVDGSTVRFMTTDGSVLDSAEQVVDYMSKSEHSTGENYFGDDKKPKLMNNLCTFNVKRCKLFG